MNSTVKSLLFWLVLVVVGVVIWNVSTKFQQKEQSVQFSEFTTQVNNGQISAVVITGQEITGSTKSNNSFRTIVPSQGMYEGLVNLLIEKGVNVDVKEQTISPWASLLYSWAPFLLVIGFWVFFMISAPI